MTDPQTVIEWMDRRMWSIATGAYVKALNRKRESEAAA